MVFSRYAAFAVAAFMLTDGAGAAAQQPVPAKSSAPVATAALSGVVRAASAPAPAIARARVVAVSPALPQPRVAITDTQGRYSFEKLPPGEYVVQASASGYATRSHQQGANSPPPPVTLAPAQRLTGIDIELSRAGVIVGRILDEDNRPFVGASVDALASRMDANQATLVSMATTVTDDRGDFRLAGLPEGQYYVSAFDPAFAEVGDETGPLRYTATYYPGVALLEQAQRVGVTAGVEPATKTIFALKIIRPAVVSGRIATRDKKQLLSGAVIMTPIHGEGLSALPVDDVRINPDGAFTFRNVAPGRYQIRARGELDPLGAALFATYRFVVNGADINDVDLVLLPGASVTGSVHYEAVTTPRPRSNAGVRVRAPFADGTSFGDSLTGDVLADGSYRIRGLMAGTHYITVEGLEPPWVLKHVQWRGQDIADVALDVGSRDVLENVRVVVTDVANDIDGVVRDQEGRPVENALVLMIPLAPQFWTPASRRFATLRTDASGRYRVRGLPAGEYRAIASVELDESQAYRKDLLRALADIGRSLTLDDPRRHTLDLNLVSLAALKRASRH